MPTLVVGELRVDVSHKEASALVDYLWRGLQAGAVTSAAKLERALGSRGTFEGEPIVFVAYECSAVRAALDARGLLGPEPS